MSNNARRIASLSPEKLDLLMRATKKREAENTEMIIQPQKRKEQSFPLSFAQQRLWFLHQWEPGSPFYNIPTALRLKGQLHREALKRSLSEIVQRHEALRTTFGLVEGQPVQLISSAHVVDLPLIDLLSLPSADREAAARHLAFQEAQLPFDLSRDPLLRTRLLHLSPDEHYLLFTMHHIVSDGWSIGIFLRELSALYVAYTTGQPSPLTPLPVQYTDFAIWQRQWLQGEQVESHLAYWQQQLHELPDMLALPTDRLRPAVQTFHGTQASFPLPATLTTALKLLSQREGVTLFMTLLAAFDILLLRYSGQEDIVVGTPIANRTHSQLEDLIGFFVNTLVLRANLADNPSFRQVLKQVQRLTLAAYDHQDLPFERLVEALAPQRALSHTPLFQVMFALQNVPLADVELPGLALRPLTVDSGTARLDLTVVLVETAQGLQVGVEYNTDLFEASTIARMLTHYQTLLAGIVADPQQRMWDLPLLTEQENQQGQWWNDTQHTYPPTATLHGLVEAQVEQSPDAIAVSCADDQVSYAELNRRANQIASLLRREGSGPESAVGLYMERSMELVVGLLGILKAGGAYVPLEPAAPSERLRVMLEDAHVAVILTQHHLVNRLPQTTAPVLYLDRDGAEPDWQADHRPEEADAEVLVFPEQVAYIIYTSGSTGRPKGVMISHQSICNRLLWMQDTYHLTAPDRVLQKTPLSFDVSVWEVFWPLLTGARLVLARPGGQQDSRYLREMLHEQAISTLHFVPSMLSVFLHEPGLEACRHLSRVICSGEALPVEVQDHFFARLAQMEQSQTNLYNLYGPTEAAVDVTWWQCEPASEQHIVPIGRPIANIDLYVLDRAGNRVPVGVPGELHIGGVGLARGYVGQADLTAERFIPHAFSGEPGARLYRTGDLVRYRADGVIEFLGRRDHQVKLRGFRIELGEIEAVLSQHPTVQETVVLVREDTNIGKYLIAYIVPVPKSELSRRDLRHFLQEHLPDYMIPAKFVLLEAFPLTSNGKLDRRALPAPETTVRRLEDSFEEPQSDLERNIARIWQDLLHLEKVGLHNNFFDLGGHSLLMFQVHKNLQERFNLDVTLVDLFTYPTVSSLAHYLGSRQNEADTPRLPTTRSQKRTELLRKQQQYRHMKD